MMKYFSIFILTVALALASCSKDSTDPSDDNSGSSSATINTDKGDLTFKSGTGAYDIENGNTNIIFSTYVPNEHEYPLGYTMSIRFKSNGIGEYSFDDDNEVIIMKEHVVYSTMNSIGKLKITKYGAIGQTIEGTFTGLFVSRTNQGTFSVEDASFKAVRLKDDDGTDPDINNPNSYMEIKMITLDGKHVDYSDDKLLGVFEEEIFDLITLTITSRQDDPNGYKLAIIIKAYNLEHKDNQYLIFNGTSGVNMIFFYDGAFYDFQGSAFMSKYAKNVGEMFEITGSGELFNTHTGEKFGTIDNFKIKVKRTE